MAKQRVYKCETNHLCRQCEYEVWNPVIRRMGKCGAPATRVIKGKKGGLVAHLCEEHAAFFMDAYNLQAEGDAE